MKKWLYIILVFQLFCVACFDDETNKDVKELNPIVIENIDLRYNSFSVYMGDTLKIEPLVFCEGIPDAKMSFEWKMFGGRKFDHYQCTSGFQYPIHLGISFFQMFKIANAERYRNRIECIVCK